MQPVRYLFIGGGQRTGTTMLQSMLCQSDLTNEMLGEASYLRGLVQAYQLGQMSFKNETEDYFTDEESYLQFHSKIIKQFLKLQFEMRADIKCLVLKEPHLTKSFPLLFNLLPEARFLLIMRDPRDSIASMVSVGEKMKQRGEQHFFQQRDMKQLSDYFQSFYLPIVSNTNLEFRKNVCLIKYEDLVSGDKEVIQTINKFVGFNVNQNYEKDLELGKFQALKNTERYHPWSTDKLGKAPDASSVGRFKSVLNTDEVRQIEHNCEQLMRQFMYV